MGNASRCCRNHDAHGERVAELHEDPGAKVEDPEEKDEILALDNLNLAGASKDASDGARLEPIGSESKGLEERVAAVVCAVKEHRIDACEEVKQLQAEGVELLQIPRSFAEDVHGLQDYYERCQAMATNKKAYAIEVVAPAVGQKKELRLRITKSYVTAPGGSGTRILRHSSMRIPDFSLEKGLVSFLAPTAATEWMQMLEECTILEDKGWEGFTFYARMKVPVLGVVESVVLRQWADALSNSKDPCLLVSDSSPPADLVPPCTWRGFQLPAYFGKAGRRVRAGSVSILRADPECNGYSQAMYSEVDFEWLPRWACPDSFLNKVEEMVSTKSCRNTQDLVASYKSAYAKFEDGLSDVLDNVHKRRTAAVAAP